MPEEILGSPAASKPHPHGGSASGRFTKGNAPRRLLDYLAYPRILFMVIFCFVAVGLALAFGIYVCFFQK